MSARKREWMRYGLAVLLAIAAFAARAVCAAWGATDLTYSFFYLVIVIVTRYAGVRAGLLAIALSHLFALIRFHTHHPWQWDVHFDPWKFTLASAVGFALLWVCYGVRKTSRAADHEATLRAQAARQTEEIVAGMPDAFFGFDRQWRFTAVNPAAERFLEMPASNLLGRVFWDVFPVLEQVPYTADMRRAMDAGQPLEIEVPSAIRPGKWIELRVVPLSSGLSIYVRDVTARQLAEAEREQLLASERAARGEAERASRLKDEFLATVSHELRTPLNAILGWAHLLRMSLQRGAADVPSELADDLNQGMDTIERNARVQTQLVEDLLDMSRIISGKLRLNVEVVDLPRVLAAAMESVRPAADAKGIALAKAIEPQDGVVRGDSARLQQVVWNLLTNAIKFTPRGGRVLISARAARMDGDPAVEIQVTDTGQGINAEFLAHAFERFRQADASTTRKHNGLGLGLSIVKHLVELHGGTVHAHSDGEGHGSTFTVCLPVVEPAQLDSSASHLPTMPFQVKLTASAAAVLSQPLKGVKVLVVDDEADARDLLRRVLEDRDAHVATACSAREALEMLSTFCPDVLLSDIGMPEQDGFAFIRQVRARTREQGGSVPAAAVTAFARAEDRDRALVAGYQAHVSKPIEPAHLVKAVADLAGQKPTA